MEEESKPETEETEQNAQLHKLDELAKLRETIKRLSSAIDTLAIRATKLESILSERNEKKSKSLLSQQRRTTTNSIVSQNPKESRHAGLFGLMIIREIVRLLRKFG